MLIIHKYPLKSFIVLGDNLGIMLLLSVSLVICLFGLAFLYFRNRRKILKLKLAMGSSQISPHFIFNSLNLLQQDILNWDIRSANKFLSRFSSLVRGILENSYHQMISLEDELSQIRDYLEIESLRFDNKFHYTIELDKGIDLKCCQVPPMVVQPFLENAIWHGLLPKKEGNEILSIEFRQLKNRLQIEIIDNGVGRKQKKASWSNPKQNPDKIFI